MKIRMNRTKARIFTAGQVVSVSDSEAKELVEEGSAEYVEKPIETASLEPSEKAVIKPKRKVSRKK